MSLLKFVKIFALAAAVALAQERAAQTIALGYRISSRRSTRSMR